jgi:DNA helicase-2/ATP-dependent DNA helicase PcrA
VSADNLWARGALTTGFPDLEGEARRAVEYRGGHLQIIAAAGSGKTEVVSQRVAALLAEGCPPAGIVAFTFTERAADSLKSRIEKRVAARLGEDALNTLNGMFVGTIHSYCFQILQHHVPHYEAFDVLDDHRLTAFLTREFYNLGLRKLSDKFFTSISVFRDNLDVVENELLRAGDLEDPFREVYERYTASLDSHRFLTYGQIIAKAVEQLKIPAIFESVHGSLQHLIVDEYQDINPAQERLIDILATSPVHLCVVGDDDQSIYQWRGSDVANIVTFSKRYPNVKGFTVEKNRRSRPDIIRTANPFAKTIQGRLPKVMGEHRESSRKTEVIFWRAETPEEEARTIAETVRRFHDHHGFAYKDIAILCRGRVSLPPILDALADETIPVQPGGRTNLFLQPEAIAFGKAMSWLAESNWRGDRYSWGEPVETRELLEELGALFELTPTRAKKVKERLEAWKATVSSEGRPANLVRDFYDLLRELGVDEWDSSADPLLANRLGTLARCSQVLVDYEATRRRARPDHQNPGEMRGGPDRGQKYYLWLAIYIQNWAVGEYEGFEGEEDVDLDAVDLTTIHQAKGLEWPIVFVPALSARRFPGSKTGQSKPWLISNRWFEPARYEGSENDERRLFYVAMTRARDYLSLSTFARMNRAASTSPFLTEVAGGDPKIVTKLPDPPAPERAEEEDEILEITFSDLAAYLECGFSYRFRRLLGFQPPIASELGYGKAVHHVLRHLAEYVRRTGKTPTAKQLDRIFDDEFYLPAANRAGYRQMKAVARKLVDRYIEEWESDLHNVWAVERPFELHLGEATVSGRADVIIKQNDSGLESLYIVDYKTAADGHDSHSFQLQVYTDAGRREGLNVDGAFVHDLKATKRIEVPVAAEDITEAEIRARTLVKGLRAKDFAPNPGSVCQYCDVRPLCRFRA